MRKRNYLFAVAVALAVNFVVFAVQWAVKHRAYGFCLPDEVRYYLQGWILLIPFLPFLVLRLRFGKIVLGVGVALLAVYLGVMTVKSHIPGSNRNLKIAACDWAVEVIRADYKGPKADSAPWFSPEEYVRPVRPVVAAHITRVSHLLGGRGLVMCGRIDIPDYIVDEERKVSPRVWDSVASFEKLAERKFGNRNFVIYRRTR